MQLYWLWNFSQLAEKKDWKFSIQGGSFLNACVRVWGLHHLANI